ncbi:MAG: hypothetical protein RLZZ352_533 [Pseudomonadota bacterium]|jgi:hypothetical protein
MTGVTEYLNELLAAEAQMAHNEHVRKMNEITLDAAKEKARLDADIAKERANFALKAEENLNKLRIQNEKAMQILHGLQIEYHEILNFATRIQMEIAHAIKNWNKDTSLDDLKNKIQVALSHIKTWVTDIELQSPEFKKSYFHTIQNGLAVIDISNYKSVLGDLDKELAIWKKEQVKKNRITKRNETYIASLAEFDVALKRLRKELSTLPAKAYERVGFFSVLRQEVTENFWLMISWGFGFLAFALIFPKSTAVVFAIYFIVLTLVILSEYFNGAHLAIKKTIKNLDSISFKKFPPRIDSSISIDLAKTEIVSIKNLLGDLVQPSNHIWTVIALRAGRSGRLNSFGEESTQMMDLVANGIYAKDFSSSFSELYEIIFKKD